MADPEKEAMKSLPPTPAAPSVEERIMQGLPALRTNLEIVNECDNFPYYETDPEAYEARVSKYYMFRLQPDGPTLGYVLPVVAETLRGVSSWSLDDEEGLLILNLDQRAAEEGAQVTPEERSAVIAATTTAMRQTGHFDVLKGWRNELYPVYGKEGELLFNMERAASALFGIVTYGVHMTAYTRTASAGSGSSVAASEIKIWVPRRAYSKSTYGGMLDNTVAGGISSGEPPLESLVREAEEEASLSADLVRQRAKAVGTVSYFHVRDKRAGGETGLLQPECQFVYDLELREEDAGELKPGDNEVEEFKLMEFDDIKEAMAKGEFKPNCALVLLDFFIRHGLIDFENETDYIEIVSRLHRRIEFPTLRSGRQDLR
ncbi:MAG: hypothetical protein M1820_001136 [Bogoriella megaspora]|nr:MAG: hypothetical protein M1820_001136 [Bogoriella megaspora]